MATKRKIPLNRISGVNAGGTATIDLPTNVRYHSIHLEYRTDTENGSTEENMEAELKEFRFNIDGVTQRAVNMAHHFDMNRSKNILPIVGAEFGYADFYFAEKQRKTKLAREATAWGMDGVNRFQIEVDIDGSATSPRLTGYAWVDDVQEAPMGIVKLKKEIIQVAATGELVYKLDTDRGDSYQGLYFFEATAGDIDRIKLEWDGVKILDVKASFYKAMMNSSDFAEVAGVKYISLDDNNPEDALPSVKRVNGVSQKVSELLSTLTMANAGNIVLYREVVGSPD